jgi:predicted PurR-regulated permease PerM
MLINSFGFFCFPIFLGLTIHFLFFISKIKMKRKKRYSINLSNVLYFFFIISLIIYNLAPLIQKLDHKQEYLFAAKSSQIENSSSSIIDEFSPKFQNNKFFYFRSKNISKSPPNHDSIIFLIIFIYYSLIFYF